MTEAVAVDAVCGMSLARWDPDLDRSHAGTTYHFCSAQCASRFAENADGYTGSEPSPSLRRARERVTLPIFDLACGGGGSSDIQRQLLSAPGVLWAYVNPATEMAYIEYHSGLITHDGLIDVVEELGYRSLRAERRDRDATPRVRGRKAGSEEKR